MFWEVSEAQERRKPPKNYLPADPMEIGYRLDGNFWRFGVSRLADTFLNFPDNVSERERITGTPN